MTEVTLQLGGTPRERGVHHGEELRSLIEAALGRWRGEMDRAGADPDRRIASLAAIYRPIVEARTPELVAEVRGIAEGSSRTFDEILALNLMDEEWWFPDGGEAGCSLVAGRPRSADGADEPPVLVQNMDLPIWMDGLQTVLRVRHRGEDASQERVILSAAGMIGLAGTRHGVLAIGVNTLLQLPRRVGGLPVAFVVRSALERPSAESAVGYLAALPHASGQHYGVVDAHDVYGVECSGFGAAVRRFPPGEWLRHTNHPLWSDPALVAEPAAAGISETRRRSSLQRLAALERAMHPFPARSTLRESLADADAGVCLTATTDSTMATFGTVEFTPSRGSARILAAHPSRGAWRMFGADEQQ